MSVERERLANPDDFRRLWDTLAQLLAEHGPESLMGALGCVIEDQARGLRLAGATNEAKCLEDIAKHIWEGPEAFPDDYPHPDWPFGPPT
jgi:hypothetical protein